MNRPTLFQFIYFLLQKKIFKYIQHDQDILRIDYDDWDIAFQVNATVKYMSSWIAKLQVDSLTSPNDDGDERHSSHFTITSRLEWVRVIMDVIRL